MTTEIAVLKQQSVLGSDFKVYGDIDNPLFSAKDVAEWIEHSDVSKMIRSIDDDEKVKNIVPTLGGLQETWFLTEEGLYETLMLSRKPIAKEFKKEVKKILKQLRLNTYKAPVNFLEAMELVVQKEKERLLLEENNKQLLVENEEMKPKVSYLEEIMQNKTLVTVSQIAKDYGMGAPSFNNMLNKHGIQYKQSGVWHLYAQYQDKGYTQSFTYKGDFKPSTRWTNKGRQFLYNVLKEKGIVPLIERESHELIL